MPATAPGGKSSSTVVFVQGELLVALDRGGKNHLFSLERSSLTELRRVTNDSGPWKWNRPSRRRGRGSCSSRPAMALPSCT